MGASVLPCPPSSLCVHPRSQPDLLHRERYGQLVRDLDLTPNKQYYLASCGDDCKVKFWDTRNA